jgi:hypothetical protein
MCTLARCTGGAARKRRAEPTGTSQVSQTALGRDFEINVKWKKTPRDGADDKANERLEDVVVKGGGGWFVEREGSCLRKKLRCGRGASAGAVRSRKAQLVTAGILVAGPT